MRPSNKRIATGILLFSVATYLVLIGCSKTGDRPDTTSGKFQQYYHQGEQLYLKHCSNCHQPNGKGLGRVYPPLDQSDFMSGRFADVICLMRNGIEGSIMVNGVEFNQPMPGIPQLTDLEIAEIATYIYNTWGRNEGIIEVKKVSSMMPYCPPNNQ